ncbi:MAG: hypothetical protein KBS59_00235 [Clostridiales bacterium]|nr:hypothetical protein [Clostridiales bacterium]
MIIVRICQITLLVFLLIALGYSVGSAVTFRQYDKYFKKLRSNYDELQSLAHKINHDWYDKCEDLIEQKKKIEIENMILKESIKYKAPAINPCVVCGEETPEGRQVCPNCEGKENE